MTLAFTPDRPYVPWVPTTLATVQDRLPAIWSVPKPRSEPHGDRQQGSREPRRTNRFHQRRAHLSGERASGVERRFTEVLLDTSAQIDKIATDLDRVIGTDGTLVTFVENANAAIKAATSPPRTSQRVRQRTRPRWRPTICGALPAIRDSLDQLRDLARQLQEQPESVVYGPDRR